jgi:hypothetical protein
MKEHQRKEEYVEDQKNKRKKLAKKIFASFTLMRQKKVFVINAFLYRKWYSVCNLFSVRHGNLISYLQAGFLLFKFHFNIGKGVNRMDHGSFWWIRCYCGSSLREICEAYWL